MRYVFMVCLIILCFAGSNVRAQEISDLDRKLESEIGQLVRMLAAQDRFSGVVLIARDGVPVFRQAYGEADKAFHIPNRVDTKFAIHSMNKMFTGTAVMQLVEKGRLSLEDPLAKYLSDFPNKSAAQKIRIKHLLTHTAGLGSFINDDFYRASRGGLRTIDEMMAFARDETLKFEPGTDWAYSQTGFLVLGRVIEVVSGMSYYDYVREHVFLPAGMRDTDNYELDRSVPDMAVGYDREMTDAGVVYRKNTFRYLLKGSSAAGAFSTAEDLLRFEIALHTNKLVAADYSAAMMSAKPALNAPNYGYGFDAEADGRIVGHRGTFPGISSNMDMFPESGYTAIVLSNYTDGRTLIVERIRALIVGDH